MFNPRHIYTVLLWLLLPYIFFHLIWRARKQPEYLHHIAERFGFYTKNNGKPVIWLHTVSVGETRAAASLIQRLQLAYPDHQLLLTHTTPTFTSTAHHMLTHSTPNTYPQHSTPHLTTSTPHTRQTKTAQERERERRKRRAQANTRAKKKLSTVDNTDAGC